MGTGMGVVCTCQCWTGLGSNGEVSEMNPDLHETHNTAETITWTLKDSEGNLVIFKVSPGRVLVQDGDEWHGVDKEKGRRIWKEYMDKGFRIRNKCVQHDMKKFYSAKRKQERNQKAMESISASMDDFVKSYKKQYAKKLYTDNWDKYALEA